MAERRWGKSRLRRAAEQHGYKLSNQQFDAYVEEGLIPPGRGPEGRLCWSPEVLDLLDVIHGLGTTVRPLPRRIIALYGDRLFPHITREQVGWALYEVIRRLEKPDALIKALAEAGHLSRVPTHEEVKAALRLGQAIIPARLDAWREEARRLAEIGLVVNGGAIPYEELLAGIAGCSLYTELTDYAQVIGMDAALEETGSLITAEG